MLSKKSPSSFIKATSVAVLIASSGMASASLYVSPVLKDEAKVNVTETAGAQKGQMGSLKAGVVGDDVDIIMTSGKDLPLHIAVENIIPTERYQVRYQEGIHEMEITWSGGNDWQDTLYVMARQNNLTVYVNEKEKVVGVSAHPDMAIHLAKQMPTIWKIETHLSLRENLKEWATQAGWQLEWDSSLDIDYAAPHDAIFMGDFVGEKGVVQELLSAYQNADTPLKSTFYLKNKVIVISRGGHKQTVNF